MAREGEEAMKYFMIGVALSGAVMSLFRSTDELALILFLTLAYIVWRTAPNSQS